MVLFHACDMKANIRYLKMLFNFFIRKNNNLEKQRKNEHKISDNVIQLVS